jgi:hypothetical protein
MLVALLAGSFARIARGRSTPTPTRSAPTPPPASTLTNLIAGDPNQIVRDFLAAIQKDSTGLSSLSYLSLELQDAVKSGTSIQDLPGLGAPFTSFNTEVVSRQRTDGATIQAL